ncbi:MAG: (E)-4-hydroxy-3-methylbut-2-enyl-diphosphate synthase, partial [Odoribacteraceae bacterium]|nr:(E)-4-hydroxy-3-methylbut-2-enyl-diphosphate synthase [Odoribacteraceae bacterium]
MRRKTIQVTIGALTLGSEHPVRLQSMLNTNTMDTGACVEQAARIVEAGGELVRITAPGVREAENLKQIRAAWRERGYRQPLSADIHFSPEAAMVAARYVEKVRINPGNFADKRGAATALTYTGEQYAAGVQQLREKMTRFLACCREHHTAVRVGTNHGSLSDRVMSRYGNTPEGMVEATLEYLRVCRDEAFPDVVVSLKSSDCRVMVDAVRLLVRRMEEEGMAYPLHLGVTEAGEGEDGRVRSAIGIGTLLNEGIGDTIRVSLTEEPEREIPVARELIKWCRPLYRRDRPALPPRCSRPVIVADVSNAACLDERVMAGLDFVIDKVNDPVRGDLLKAGIQAPEMVYAEALGPELTKLPAGVTVIVPLDSLDVAHVYNRSAIPYMDATRFKQERAPAGCVELRVPSDLDEETRALLAALPEVLVVLYPPSPDYALYREMLEWLAHRGVENKIIVRVETREADPEVLNVAIPSRVGGLFLDRLAHGIWITCRMPDAFLGLTLSRDILQSTGTRRYKTEFISCPGCGRTLFNLQDAVRAVKRALACFPRLKIAVMGCIVNGPGEMGDADYGYVGAGHGKVTL